MKCNTRCHRPSGCISPFDKTDNAHNYSNANGKDKQCRDHKNNDSCSWSWICVVSSTGHFQIYFRICVLQNEWNQFEFRFCSVCCFYLFEKEISERGMYTRTDILRCARMANNRWDLIFVPSEVFFFNCVFFSIASRLFILRGLWKSVNKHLVEKV